MGVIRRQSILSSLVNYVGIIVGYLTVGYLFPKYLEPSEFGLTRIILSVATVIAVIARLGFNSVIIKYYPYYKDERGGNNGLLFYSLVIPLFSFLLVSLAFVALKPYIVQQYEKSPLFVEYAYFVIPLAFFLTYILLFEAYLQSLYDLFFVKFVNDILVRLFVVCCIFMFVFGWLKFDSFVLAFVLSYGMALVVLMIYIRLKGVWSMSFNKKLFSFKKSKELLSYGYYIMLSGGAGIIVSQIDTIMLAMLSGEEKVAVFTIGMYMGKVILVPKNTLNQLSKPRVAELWKSNKLDQIEKLYQRTSVLQIIFGLAIFSLLWVNVDNIFRFVPDGKFYSQGKMVILYISLASIFDLATSLNTPIINLSPRYKFTYRLMIAVIFLTIATNYIFIPKYGISGAAMATAITIFIHNFAKFLFIKIRFKMQPFTWPMAVPAALCIASIGISMMIPYIGQKHLDVLMRSGIVGVIFVLPVYFFKISSDVNKMVNMFLKKAGINIE